MTAIEADSDVNDEDDEADNKDEDDEADDNVDDDVSMMVMMSITRSGGGHFVERAQIGKSVEMVSVSSLFSYIFSL